MDPITLAGLGLTGGSILANIFADDARQRAFDQTMRNADFTNMAFQGAANATNARARDRYADFGGKMATKGKSLGDYFISQSNPAGGGSTSAVPMAQASAAPGSKIMANEQAKQTGAARAYNDQQGRALGDFRAFGETMGDAERGVARDAGDLAMLLDQWRGANKLVPMQLADSQRAGSGMGLAADLMRGGGRLMMGYGMQKPLVDPGAAPFSTSMVPNSVSSLRDVNLFDLFR